MMISCPSCKSKIDSSAKTCPFCGATGSGFERQLMERAKVELKIIGNKVDEKQKELEKEKKLIVNCKSCSKKLKKYLHYPTINPNIIFTGLVKPVSFCLVCYKNHLNNQFHGLILLYRKNPSFTWTEMSVKNKIVSILQILLIIILLLTGTFI